MCPESTNQVVSLPGSKPHPWPENLYWPENWPGRRAPAIWNLEPGWVDVSLWIFYADRGEYFLDFIAGGCLQGQEVATAKRFEVELEERRDDELRKSEIARTYMGTAA